MHTISIQSRNGGIAANRYFPPQFGEARQYLAIISAHPIGSCKEQTAGNVYGAALAEQGYVVIAFDASFQGATAAASRATWKTPRSGSTIFARWSITW